MNVYIIYEKDGYGGTHVDKVFREKRDAMDYIIQTKFAGNSWYKDRSKEFIDGCAIEFIE